MSEELIKKQFRVDARTVLTLGRDSIKDHTTAILELVKNSYDAEASHIKVEIISKDDGTIRIIDNGHGMTESQIEENWLRIGHSGKRSETFTTKYNRRKTGEKGIGRLSADRLGSQLTLITKSSTKDINGLYVDWAEFEKEGVEIGQVGIDILSNVEIDLPSVSDVTGTEIIIKKLRNSWNESDIQNLIKELSILISPFDSTQEFKIELFSDVLPELNGDIKSVFYDNSEIELNAEFFPDNQSIKYSIKVRDTEEESKTIEWNQLSQKGITQKEFSPNELICGPVKVKFLFYLRDASGIIGKDISLTELREFLNINSGVKIYRDNIRVKPYGDSDSSEGDWLELGVRKSKDPAGVARSTYKISPGQIVGAIFVTRDGNSNLIDSSSREGLLKGQAFNDLCSLSLGCITLIENYRYEQSKKGEKTKKKAENQTLDAFEEKISDFSETLKTIAQAVPAESKAEVYQAVEKLAEMQNEVKNVEKFLSEKRVLAGLATIGITSAVFGHETQSSISQFISSTNLAIRLINKDPINVSNLSNELNKSKRYAEKVAAWGAFALSRVQQEKRVRKISSVDKIIEKILADLKPLFDVANIEIEKNLEEIQSKIYHMDLDAIVLNLLTNAYTACLQKTKSRKVKIILKKSGMSDYEIAVSDSGNGVAEDFKERIWLPLITTKKNNEGKETGTGLGLTIIQSILKDLHGSRKIETDEELGGAKFIITLPINL